MNEIFREIEETKEEVLVVEGRQIVLKIISYRREYIQTTADEQKR